MISVGQIGRAHLETYQTIPEVIVVAIADTDREHARQVTGRFGSWLTLVCFNHILVMNNLRRRDFLLP
jgi:predicted dehydrogenase